MGFKKSGWQRVDGLDGRTKAALLAFVSTLATAVLVALAGGPGLAFGEAAAACPQAMMTSAEGTVVHLSPCALDVEITSPTVRTVYGNEADNTIYAGPNVETIYGEGGNDVIHAGPSTLLIEGGTGEDIIYGEPTENEIIPGGGIAYEPETEAGSAPAGKGGVNYQPETGERSSPNVESVESTPLVANNEKNCEEESPCLGGTGDQKMRGGPGSDVIFGERGDDEIWGEGGDDTIYGGDGDDKLYGGEGDDFIAGGPGTDEMFGENGNDLLRGDGTIDKISGGSGEDTVSFATAVTPGFAEPYPSDITQVSGFPGEGNGGEGRGVYVRLDGGSTTCGYPACNNAAGTGGGDDEIEVNEIENVIGSPFADIIVGSSGANRIYGGGGGDVIIGDGGADHLYGGEDGDFIEGGGEAIANGGAGPDNCIGVGSTEGTCGSEAKVTQHEASTMSAGVIFTTGGTVGQDGVYVIGSSGNDSVSASYSGGTVTFVSNASTRFGGESEGCEYTESGARATCPLPTGTSSFDALVMAGMEGNDTLSVFDGGIPLTTSPQILGESGNDTLLGSDSTEDVLVDGPGQDLEKAYGYDDWLLNNGGKDTLEGGGGNDLFLSTTTCDGDTLNGAEAGANGDGEAQNNASWAKLSPAVGGVTANLALQSSGSGWNEANQSPTCPGGTTDNIYGMDDLEGSNQGDILFGNDSPNSILGHSGDDWLNGQGGNDTLLAKDGEKDTVVGGAGTEDICKIDWELDNVEGCEELEPPPIPTTTYETIPKGGAVGGETGSITLHGRVKPNRNTVKGHGHYVNVNFLLKEGNEWKLVHTAHEVMENSQTYEVNAYPLSPGSYKTRAVFPQQGQFLASSSNYHTFEIAPSKYPTETFLTVGTVTKGAPGKVELHGHVNTPKGGGPINDGAYVNVNFQKWVNGAWEAQPSETEHVVVVNGAWEIKEHVGHDGKWQARAVFPEQQPYGKSESAFHAYTVEAEGYDTETFLTLEGVKAGQPGHVSLSGHVNVVGGEGGPINGHGLTINFEKLESGAWKLKNSVKPTITNGAYSVSEREEGVGTWRAQAVFEQTGLFGPSQSPIREFVIAAK